MTTTTTATIHAHFKNGFNTRIHLSIRDYHFNTGSCTWHDDILVVIDVGPVATAAGLKVELYNDEDENYEFHPDTEVNGQLHTRLGGWLSALGIAHARHVDTSGRLEKVTYTIY